MINHEVGMRSKKNILPIFIAVLALILISPVKERAWWWDEK